jgi:hypothetical protein
MHRCPGIYVMKNINLIILVDHFGRDPTLNDFAKNAIRIAGLIR